MTPFDHLLHHRQRQDGCALQVLRQPCAAHYLLLPGQPCQARASTLRLLREGRARREQRGLLVRTLERVPAGVWTVEQARVAAWLIRN